MFGILSINLAYEFISALFVFVYNYFNESNKDEIYYGLTV